MKGIFRCFTSALVAIVFIFALLLVGARVIGFDTYAVLSGSMEPKYPVGSLLYVQKVDVQTLKPNDVITFMLDEHTVVTHRIVEVVKDETDPNIIRFKTKGDANNTEDIGLVHYKNVIGAPKFHIPYLGYVAFYISRPPGLYVAISAGAFLILLVFLPDLFSDSEKRKRGKKDEKQICESH